MPYLLCKAIILVKESMKWAQHEEPAARAETLLSRRLCYLPSHWHHSHFPNLSLCTHTLPLTLAFFSPPLIILRGNSYIGGAKWFTPELSLPAQPLKTATSSGRKEQPCVLPSASAAQKAPDKNERRSECRSWWAIKRPSQQNQHSKKLQMGLPLFAEKL